MKVHQIMTTSPEACGPETNVAAAVELLWNADCGVLPVVDAERRIVGIVTDRDICIALGTRNCRASELTVSDVMRTDVELCEAGTDVSNALRQMKQRRVRRLPVVDANGRLTGILSLDDAVLASATTGDAVRPAQLIETLQAVCARRVPVPTTTEPAAV